MEKQIFNSTLVIVFVFMLAMMAFNIIIRNWLLTGITFFVIVGLVLCYYLLRNRNQFKYAYFIFGGLTYPILAINFFNNDGIEGPTFYIFILCHLIILTISPIRSYFFWSLINGFSFLVLYYIGTFQNQWVPRLYDSNELIFIDHTITYLACLIGIGFLVATLKRFYRSQKNKVKVKSNELIRINRSLSKTSSQKDKIITIISHDLKNPLQSIMQTLELINKGELPPDEMEFLHEELLKITTRTYNMMENILDWSSFELKNTAIRTKEIRLKELFEDTIEILKVIAKQKSISLSVNYRKNPLVKIETDRLLLILRNLVQNAIKFTASGGQVSMEIFGQKDLVTISIQDNGIGISQERLKKIFEQDIKSTYGTEQEKGTGMGLHLCFQNAKRLGGTLEVVSKEGNGSNFTLTIPSGLNSVS
ncbi:sensor histidine kinase [Cyclobacterium jeungdonense]|uniref:histidine kinase n=1 Tax=Cyclobacterium jeungdonense TaxID=708087 RepID=A0ABT8C6T6_9BACT|nr:HAMP domain-containing sensor histidine kinase [Cyclobacterium jeungdonense]MDN3687832.1 HAMP domain-containing sensor histidine kinase [Cyclobacterium jeungdonense]